ncbi:helix-turn-helix domain-containing protein [Candidatus Enterococcus willemsii]|uniref:Mga helix-turn-helix domain-containing protein n=1 Tax=Candidatus Enterococcus willemsii TaxID=1857215 RepID=A0ABQ6YWV0_9ENTE|nr:helix-turn-helix domain-containing protein [Enterococcus sp. CU12B]KAF1302176.1 hypothetical protein BAU17_02030 [Enterococcus sp. CU12B]
MFGFTPSIWMMRDILRHLDEQVDYIPSNQLLETLGYSTLGQVQKICKDLQDIIMRCYPNKEVELVINRHRGIKLVRHSENMQKLLDFIASQDLAFSIYQKILFKRTLSTSDFCREHFISLSTLQRKIKEINSYLNKYGLHITLSQTLKITGAESTIRCFTFIFLYIVHRQLSNIYWLNAHDTYLEQTKAIAQHLKLAFRQTETEVFALLLFVSQQAIDQQSPICFDKENFPHLNDLLFPEKPEVLASWEEDEWKFLLLTAYNSNLANFDIPIDVSNLSVKEIDAAFNQWITLFENYFRPFDNSNRSFLYENFLKRYFSSFFFEVDQTLLAAFPAVDFSQLARTQPYYFQQFQKFWTAFVQATSWNDAYFETQSFLLCEYCLPLRYFLPKIKLFIFTDLTALSLHRIKDTVALHFSNKYHVQLVSTPQEADVIIGTINYREKLAVHQTFVMTSIQLTKQDLTTIDQAIQRIVLD